ncbi:hypothetical protein CDEST_08618 [Colletotrichum destructivum]|uniref:Uncharacterized protein n=1 Tax=Colletotrichum destructivum TaxID=34406 RepID=A0AAX4IL44_9PEZI|nr:hypothetical protein CDEST_08618 [Colletotrichum destructivum]
MGERSEEADKGGGGKMGFRGGSWKGWLAAEVSLVMRWPRPAVCVLERTAEALEAAHPNEAPLLVFTISKLTMAMMTFQGQKKGRRKGHQRYEPPASRPEAT